VIVQILARHGGRELDVRLVQLGEHDHRKGNGRAAGRKVVSALRNTT